MILSQEGKPQMPEPPPIRKISESENIGLIAVLIAVTLIFLWMFIDFLVRLALWINKIVT